MEMRLARREDIACLTRLWQECFGDEDAYIDAFYAHRFDSILVPTVTDGDGTIIGAIHMLPCTYGKRTGMARGYYLYAVCVTPAWRGTGAMRMLLGAVVEECRKKSLLLTLSPVNDKLIAYYESYGFRMTAGYFHGFFDRADADSSCAWKPCGAKDYFRVREACLDTCVHLAFDAGALDYALLENASFNGSALCSSEGDCALVQKEGVHLVVREFCTSAENTACARARLLALLSSLGSSFCEVRTHIPLDGLKPHFALMAHGGTPSDVLREYANLLLD